MSPDAKRLRVFSAARLVLTGLLLTFVPFLPAEFVPGMQGGMLAVALLAALASGAAVLLMPPLAAPRRMAWLLSVLDAVLVTAIVASTGGSRSIFTFLYVLTVVAASVLLSRPGAIATAALASALYVGLVFGRTIFPMTAFFEPPVETTALEVLTMFLNTGTFLTVAIVAGGLAERFRETRQELESQRRDLRDLQAFKDVIFHSVSAGLVALDRDHVITAFNRAAESITGVSARDAIGRPGRAVLGDSVPLASIDAAIARNPHASARHETTLARPDAASVPVRMTFSALTSGDGTRLGLIAVCEDLSRIREMEARVRQADRLAMLGRMSANIAHEIRNPLASLTGAIEALASAHAADDDRERLSQIVLRESDRLNDIVRSFLDYARPAPLAIETVCVSEILEEVLLLLEHGTHPSGVKIVGDFPDDVVWRLDAQQFRQALWNLCLNGIDAMPGGGELRVSAMAHRGRLEISVSDTGEGISDADLAHVFEPFFSTKPGGSGLGLALVQRIVTEHGGHVDVRSVVGAGTTVTMSLAGIDA